MRATLVGLFCLLLAACSGGGFAPKGLVSGAPAHVSPGVYTQADTKAREIQCVDAGYTTEDLFRQCYYAAEPPQAAPSPAQAALGEPGVPNVRAAPVYSEPTYRQPASPPAPTYSPGCAENGSCYGDISTETGRPKTVAVGGYYRKNGTYVRGHYRSHK